jgi:putative methyltransferase
MTSHFNSVLHLSLVLSNRSSIIAIERDAKRCNTLRQTISNARASKVSVQRADFLNLDPSDYQDVKYILVDPSCSGTGMTLHKSMQRYFSSERTFDFVC